MANNVIKRVWNQNRMVAIEDLKGMTFQAESGGHTFQISGVDDSGNTVALTGTPAGVLLRPDNTDVALTCSVSGGVVSATLPANCYDVPGRFGLTIFITSGSSKTAIYAAVGTVTRTSSGTVAPGTSQSVVDLINAINAAVNSIPASYSALLADIAPTYSNSALYSVGQYAWYDGDLKRCIVPITTAESYTAAHWTSAVLGQDVSDLKSALSSSNIPDLNITDNKYVNYETGAESNSNNHCVTDYIALDNPFVVVKTHTYSNSDVAGICFYDENKTYITGLKPYADNDKYVSYIAPNNAKYIRVSCFKANSSALSVTFYATTVMLNSIRLNVEGIDERTSLKIVSEFTDDKYIDKSTGEESSNSNYSCTDYIEIIPTIPMFVVTAMYNDASGLCYYDKDKTFISGRNINTSAQLSKTDLTIPGDAKYIRYTCVKSKKSGAYLSYSDNKTLFDILFQNVIIPNTITVTPSWTYGKYCNSSGVMSTSNNYRYYDVILSQYEKLTATGTDPSGTAVAFLSKWKDESTFDNVIALGSTTLKTVEYTATEATERIRISVYNNDSSFSAEITSINIPQDVLRVLDAMYKKEEQYINISMFDSIGVCGDSYTAGAIFEGSTLKGEYEKTSWGKVLERRCGFDVSVFAKGGADTHTYLTEPTCLPALLSDDAKELYIIVLGINDYSSVTLGDIDDIDDEDPTQNPNTFYGNYGRIIENIKNHAPNALIVISKTFLPNYLSGQFYDYSSEAIEEIASHYGIPYIETMKSDFLKSDLYNNNVRTNGGHPTAPYYSGIAKTMENLLNEVMVNYSSYFVHYLPN